ncbi:MAG: type VI secretion system tip protein VgrG, partial [Deltaproteobacteria bacterium]|nr:type VI secretion system tip protein VgrG [Deltaproteobacteria bacterium]
FVAIPSSVTFRPERNTPKPVVEGVQTAIVVGPSGEEIYTDEFARVKVKFHWDRVEGADETSSCWIRVSQLWAGVNWGAMFIPRIGQEVIIDFIEGDPDRPIITGRVYNQENMPPYGLPDQKTKSAIKTNSSIGGDGFNEIRFEDKKGEEELFIHGQKNLEIRVKNDRRETIGRDRHLVVENDKKEVVKNNRHDIVKMDWVKEIGKDRHLTVKGKEAKKVTESLSLTVEGEVIEVFKAAHSEQATGDYYLKADNVVIEAMNNITLCVGSSYITIEAGSIDIKTGGQVSVDGTSMTEIKGGMVKIN